MLTIGCGQRIGLIAGSGVGKSVLLGMLTKFTAADVVVIGLIGERGREVKEFIENTLGPEGLKKSVGGGSASGRVAAATNPRNAFSASLCRAFSCRGQERAFAHGQLV